DVMSNRCQRTRGSFSSAWTSRMLMKYVESHRPSLSAKRTRRVIHAQQFQLRPRFMITCGCYTRAWARPSAASVGAKSIAIPRNRVPMKCFVSWKKEHGSLFCFQPGPAYRLRRMVVVNRQRYGEMETRGRGEKTHRRVAASPRRGVT